LRTLCPGDGRLSRVGAPVPVDSVLTKRQHAIPMGSQDKALSRQEFEIWAAGMPLSALFHANYKADGCSINLEFVAGKLYRAITRGDGNIGEDVTSNALKFRGLPSGVVSRLGFPFTGNIRCEAVLPVADWAKLDPLKEKNPRNLGTGICRRKNGEDAELMQLIAFRGYDEHSMEFRASEDAMEVDLREMGFFTAPSVVGDKDVVWAFYEATVKERSALPYWIDGVVCKVWSFEKQRALGVAGGCPRGQVAIKFLPEGAEATIRSVELTVGRTGTITPVAAFDGIALGGVTVTSSTLCNFDEIRALNVAIGDTVFVCRQGDVIPKIISVTKRPECRQPIPEPTACPVCSGKLERRINVDGEEGTALMCVNDVCPGRLFATVSNWLKSLKILGVDDKVQGALRSQLGIGDAADLYGLKARAIDLANLSVSGIRFGEKRAAKVIEGIEARRSLTLEEFMGSLGVDGLACRRVELIRWAVPGQMDTLAAWMDGRLLGIAAAAGVPNLAERFVADIAKKRSLIDRLLAAGVSVLESTVKIGPPGGGPSFCITGALSKPKAHFKALGEARGWEWKEGVSKGLTYLCMADPASPSAKAQKARDLGTKCISEAELLELLK